MASIELYRASINRKHKPRTKALLNNIVNSVISDYVLRADGCDITNTSSYIDVKISSGTDWANRLYECNYIRIVNQTTQTYFAYLDRVEPNNFNDLETHSYRLFFTIDWWCTLLYRLDDDKFEEMLQSLDGAVERAHVTDIVKSGDVFKPSLNFTTSLPEEAYTDTVNDGFILSGDNGVLDKRADEIMWCYILFRFSNTDWTEGYTTFADRYSHAMTAPCGVACIPVKGGTTVEYYIEYKNDNNDTGSVTYPGGTPLSVLTDERIIHMFLSPIAPVAFSTFDDSSKKPFGFYVYSYRDKYGDWLKESSLKLVTLETNAWTDVLPGYLRLPCFAICGGYLCDFNEYFNSNRYKLPIIPTTLGDDITKPSNYNEFLSTIVKARSEAYTKVVLYCNGNAEELPISRMTGFTCGVNFETGGILLTAYRNNDNTFFGVNKNIGLDSTFELYQKIDRLKTFQGVIGGAINSSSQVFSGYGGKELNTLGVVKGYAGATGTAINTIFDMLSQSRGITSDQPFGQTQTFGVDVPQLIITQPINLVSIRDKLIMYGYNTTLTMQQVLTLKRKYYNFIKVNSANITYPILCAEARLAIEEMFNNGVWLWNSINASADDCKDGVGRSNAMGYLWLNNYPLAFDN